MSDALTEAGRFAVPADHPALPGHFPGDPVVPAVVLLDAAAELVLQAYPGHRLCGVPQAKFMRPVRPDEQLVVSYAPTPPRIRFACHLGDAAAVRGVLLLAPTV